MSWPCALYSEKAAEVQPRLLMKYRVPINGEETVIGNAFTPPWVIENNNEYEEVGMIAGCPTLAFMVGIVSASWHNKTADYNVSTDFYLKHDLSYFACSQNMEQVVVEVTFNLPDMTISTMYPPKPDESNARYLEFTSENYTGRVFSNSVEALLINLPDNSIPSESYISPFIKALIHSNNGYPVDELLGSVGHRKVLDSANSLYATYMAQAINANFRVEGQPPAQKRQESNFPTTYNATLTQPNRQRIKQDRVVKSALQAMLLFMSICAGGIYFLSHTKEVLPHNPCSIAGTMSLLAGSEMASRKLVPVGSEWRQESDHVWDGWLFSLGWWGDREHRRYGIDVGRADRSFKVKATAN